MLEWLDGAIEAFSSPREAVARQFAMDRLLYEGVQWLVSDSRGRFSGSHLGRLGRNIESAHPDARRLRATLNAITRHVSEVASQTSPSKIGFDLSPHSHDADPDANTRVAALEAGLESAMDRAKYLDARRVVNVQRTICGTYGLMLSMTPELRSLQIRGEQREMYDRRHRFQPFDPTKLILDPAESSGDLEDHEYVIYSDVWTLEKIRRIYGVELDAEQCQDIGQLVPMYLELNRLTDGRLFGQYKSYSRTKGAVVYQIHCKDESGRFASMYVVVDAGYGEGKKWINPNNFETPFGGCGLPLWLYHGVSRSDSVYGISDVRMMRDAQLMRNIAWSFLLRHMQASAGSKWIVDMRALPQGMSAEAFNRAIDNDPFGAVFFDSSRASSVRGVNPPQVAQVPVIPPSVPDLISRFDDEISAQVHRVDATRGLVKSHVPDSSFQTAINRANQPLDDRVRGDLETDLRVAKVTLGTLVLDVRSGNPSTLEMLRRLRMDAEDVRGYLRTDPSHPDVEITVRESSVRARSHESRRSDLRQAMELQVLGPDDYRAIMARDLDAPISDSDKRHQIAALRAAQSVMRGMDWQPKPLGRYASFYVDAFRDMLASPAVRRDPEAERRLVAAIDNQELYELQKSAAMQAMMQPQQPQISQGAAPQQGAEATQPLTIGSVLGPPVA